MNRLAFVVVVLAGCGSKAKPVEPIANDVAPLEPCPIPSKPEVAQRFAVGGVPDYRVPGSIPGGSKCHAVFIANDVIAITDGRPRLVKAGTFKGHCPDEADAQLTFEAVSPAKATISVATREAGTPIALDSKTPDKTLEVLAGVADRCGTAVSAGIQDETPSTWAAGADCEKVAKIVPWESNGERHAASALTAIAAIGPGTCTISVELLGVKGQATVTVK